MGAAFGIRAIADTQHVGWLNWVSPLGLRASVRPFLDNRWWVLLATGVRRWVPLAAQVGVTAVGSAIILLATGLLSALIAPTLISGTDVSLRAFAYAAGQWPAVMAAAGWTALLIGCLPRLTGLAWLIPVVGGTLALLGQLLGIPQWLLDLGLFRQVPDISSASPDVRALFVLVAFSWAACLLGVVSIRRRDVITG